MEKIIAIDVGTQSLRSTVFGANGEIFFFSSDSYSPDFSPGNKVEQPLSTWKNALFKTMEAVGKYLRKNGIRPLCIAVTSQRASVIPMDENDEPLHDAYMWQDKRAVEDCAFLLNNIGGKRLYRESGLRLDPYFSLPKILYYRRHHKKRWDKTKKIIGVQDYINLLLTGNYKTDYSQACRTMMFDIDNLSWNEPLLDALSIPTSMLCELCPPGDMGGTVSNAFAEATGIPQGLPVHLCGGDQQCASLGLGLLKKGQITANTGTGSFVLGYSENSVRDKKQRTLCSCGAVPDRYIVEAGIYASGAMYNWCREQLFDVIDGHFKSFDEVNCAVESVPCGAGGVIVLPHFQGSAAPYWNPIAKGVIYNLGLGTTKPELCRAILEGIALEISTNIKLIEKQVGEVNEVFLAGGLTNFSGYCQMLADALNKPVIRRPNNEATLTGAVISVCVKYGIYNNYQDACDALIPAEQEVFEPIEAHHKIYEKTRKVKRTLYDALKKGKVYDKTRELLG